MLYDVDALAAEFTSIEIKFRGSQYKLGESVEQILGAINIAKAVPDDAPLEEQLKILGPVLGALCPELGVAVGDGSSLTLAERLVLQRVVREGMGRITKIPFRPVA